MEYEHSALIKILSNMNCDSHFSILTICLGIWRSLTIREVSFLQIKPCVTERKTLFSILARKTTAVFGQIKMYEIFQGENSLF